MKPICLVKEMQENDLAAVSAGATSISLLKKAGEKLYENIPEANRYLILCGKGNNGGDGYVCADYLYRAGKNVSVLCLEKPVTADSLYSYEICQKNGIICCEGYKEIDFSRYDVIVDCLFGIGFRGEMQEPYKTVVSLVNASGAYVVSCDIASGISGDNGLGEGIRADKVVAIQSYKYGHFLNRGKDFHRSAVCVDIGIPVSEWSFLCERQDFVSFFQERENYSYKGKFGYDAIFAGSENFSGASKLAALGCSAMRAGAGVLRLAVPTGCQDAVRPYLLETTLFDENKTETVCKGASCIGVGCGWGRDDDRIDLLRKILQIADCPVLIDADGLYAFKKLEFSFPTDKKIVITPHYAEMAHLCDVSPADIEKNPVGYAKGFAARYGVIVALKGASTVVTDGKKILLTATGCAGMATAGSGDVLLGIMTAVVGQKIENLLLSVAYATFLNGIAGELAQKEYTDIGMTASDTVANIPKAVKFLRKMI